jgi:hypothetical protein
MLKRRSLVKVAAVGAGLSLLPFSRPASSAAQLPKDLQRELQQSDLIYLTPIQSNGLESSCQAEIWYVWDGSDIYVCTDTTAWRVRAVAKGLDRTRIWVGDLGNWKRTNGKYKALPKLETTSTIIKDESVHARTLKMFGKKYPIGWIRYKSAFTEGLASGSRTLLKYHPASV